MEDTLEAELVTILPFWTTERADDGTEYRYAVRLFRSHANLCEQEGKDRCDRSGYFYGCDRGGLEGVMKYCPRHWYELHRHDFQLADMTDEEHKQVLRHLARDRWSQVSTIADQLVTAGQLLSGVGFAAEADKLFQTAGAIQVIARQASLM